MTMQPLSDVKEFNPDDSAQPRAKPRDVIAHVGLLNYLIGGTYRVSPWWSRQRDLDLDKFYQEEDHLFGAIGSLSDRVCTVPVRVVPRDSRLASHRREAEDLTILLNEESEMNKGWISFSSRWVTDFWTCDNGAFAEILGPGDPTKEIKGKPTGLMHLDSHRCQRTGDYTYPVLYWPIGGNPVKYHRTRVTFSASMESPREAMFGVGHCAISRAIQNAQHLMDIATYKAEKLGSRPLRAILVGGGIATDAILDALEIAEREMSSQGHKIMSKIPVLGDVEADANLNLVDLASLPDGFDEETST